MAYLALPYRGKINFSSPYGDRTLNSSYDWHSGIDLVGLDEKIVRAPCAARVAVSTILYKEFDRTRTWEWGNYVRLDCDDGTRVYLCHLAERYVEAGQTVSIGEPIGVEGKADASERIERMMRETNDPHQRDVLRQALEQLRGR